MGIGPGQRCRSVTKGRPRRHVTTCRGWRRRLGERPAGPARSDMVEVRNDGDGHVPANRVNRGSEKIGAEQLVPGADDHVHRARGVAQIGGVVARAERLHQAERVDARLPDRVAGRDGERQAGEKFEGVNAEALQDRQGDDARHGRPRPGIDGLRHRRRPGAEHGREQDGPVEQVPERGRGVQSEAATRGKTGRTMRACGYRARTTLTRSARSSSSWPA